MLIEIITPDAFRAMPWKNGGGSTLELFRFAPTGCGDFAVRLSIANVNNTGPFSLFDGIDRQLMLLSGHGVQLKFADGSSARLNHPLQSIGFAGDLPCDSELINGPIQDFNLMVRRNYGTGDLSWIALKAGESIVSPQADHCFYYLLDGEIKIGHRQVKERHLVKVQSTQDVSIQSEYGARIVCAKVTER